VLAAGASLWQDRQVCPSDTGVSDCRLSAAQRCSNGGSVDVINCTMANNSFGLDSSF
jgi:hypothetical protein